MSEYRNKTTGEVKSQGQWRNTFKNTSLPRTWKAATLEALDLEPVFEAPRPDAGKYQTVVRNGVEKDSKGNWVTAWQVRDMFSDYTDEDGNVVTKAEQEVAYQADLDAKAAESVRKKRDGLLAETDWRVIKAYETSANIPAEWEIYRQALRDITTLESFPYLEEADWPIKPE